MRTCERHVRSPFVDASPDQFILDDQTQIDAIFIPSQRGDCVALEMLHELSSVSRIVCILPTRDAVHSFTRHTLPENVRVVPDHLIEQAHQRFLVRPSSSNPSQKVSDIYDLPIKRNIALQLARDWGLRKICLLDDDITISRHQILTASSAVSNNSPMAGFYVLDYPDVSTIDHVERLTTGMPSMTIPGGNCLFLLVEEVDGYFPYIYNDDWIYVLNNGTRKLGTALGEVRQSVHAPWNDHGRVRFEEFGEVVISGLLELDLFLDAPEAISESLWKNVIITRLKFLERIGEACTNHLRRKAIAAAVGTLVQIFPQDCVRFVKAMRAELSNLSWLSDILKLI